jgi:hypothetical protein
MCRVQEKKPKEPPAPKQPKEHPKEQPTAAEDASGEVSKR